MGWMFWRKPAPTRLTRLAAMVGEAEALGLPADLQERIFQYVKQQAAELMHRRLRMLDDVLDKHIGEAGDDGDR